MSVEVSPSQLGFQRPLTQLVKRILTVTNPNPQPIAFKVKTTAPKQYCVRPNSGRIEPGERVDVSVLLQPMKEDPEPGAKCRDKFLVQSIIITPERESTAFPELWSLIEKESKGSIAEHKIRCVYLPANAEDAPLSPNSLSHKSHPNHNSPSANNHTNRDEDDDHRYNSVRSHPNSTFRPQASPPDLPTNDHPETTVYDIAMDETFEARPTRPSTSTLSTAALKVRNSAQSHHSSTPVNEMPNHRPASSTLSTSGTKGQASSITSSSTDDIHKLRSQLAAALDEVERLKALLASHDAGLRKRTSHSAGNDSQRVHSADMLSLDSHGLKGPEGLVPVQTVIMISIGVFAFTWLFF